MSPDQIRMDIPGELIEDIIQRKCGVFVGAGLSQGAGLPGWVGLLRRMMDWSEHHGINTSDRSELEGYIQGGELLLVAEEMRERLGRDLFRRFLVEEFTKPNLKPTDTHRLLPCIPFVAALTTNYDTLIESTYTLAREGSPVHIFTQMEVPELSASLRSNEFYILKTHGTIDRIETVVLGRSDYRDITQTNQAYHSHLNTFFSTHTVLFLGFGLSDPDLLLFLDELRATFKNYTGKHFALMNAAEAPPIKQSRFEKDYGIHIIPYNSSAPDHPEVRMFLAGVVDQVKCTQAKVVVPGATLATIEDFGAYYNILRKRYQRIDLEGLTPPQKEEYLQLQLTFIFTEQNVRENPPPVELPKEIWDRLVIEGDIRPEDLPKDISFEEIRKAREAYFGKPSRRALDVLTDSAYENLVILGDPGSGKSTLARYIILSLIGGYAEERMSSFTSYFPLLIELRTYSLLYATNKCDTFLQFLAYLGKTEGWNLTLETLNRYFDSDGRAFVIFDGLDEIFDPKLRERITRQIIGFASDHPTSRIIVTSRIIGYRHKLLSDAGFSHFTLQDLDEEQVAAFVDRWYELALSDRPDEAKDRRERILRSFKESRSIRQLAGNPMLLTILAIIGKHQELPRERWKLYDHAVSVLIQHWDVNKHLENEKLSADFIGEDDKKELLRRLAYLMQSSPGGLSGNHIDREILQKEFESYLEIRYGQTPDRATIISRSMIEQFRERNFILSLYGANIYGFVHRAFLEYFCATAYTYKFEKKQEITLEQLKSDVFGLHMRDRNWHEVLRLICAMLDDKFAGQIIEYLVDDSYQQQSFLGDDQRPWNVALAVQCLGETRSLNEIAEPAKKVLNAIYWILEYMAVEDSTIEGFIENELLPAIELIGHNWPHRITLKRWLREFKSYPAAFYHAELFGRIIGSVGRGLPEIHQVILSFARNVDSNYRVLAPFALLKGWRDDEHTLALLKDLALTDDNEYVRRSAKAALAEYIRNEPGTYSKLRSQALSPKSLHTRLHAISALADYFASNPETFDILKQTAVSDTDAHVRSAALSALARNFIKNSQSLMLLLDSARNDLDGEVRSTALFALADHFPSAIETFELLVNQSINDKDESVRSAAISALGNKFSNNSQTLDLICERVFEDSSVTVRSASILALAEHFSDEPRTLEVIRSRAAKDEYWVVRSTAISLLADYFHSDAETLKLIRGICLTDLSPKPDDYPGKDKYPREVAIEALARVWPIDNGTVPLLYRVAENDQTEWIQRMALQAARALTREYGKEAYGQEGDEDFYKTDGRELKELFLQHILDSVEDNYMADTYEDQFDDEDEEDPEDKDYDQDNEDYEQDKSLPEESQNKKD